MFKTKQIVNQFISFFLASPRDSNNWDYPGTETQRQDLATKMPANGKPNGRFELPQFTPLNYSLTDGTDIPPPPDSPIEEKAPPQPPKQEQTEDAKAGGSANGENRGRTDDQVPVSPSSTTRPSSIRRFLSRRSLNSNYVNGNNTNKSREDLSSIAAQQPERPASSLSQVKRKSSWFSRLGSSKSSKRTSTVFEESSKPVQKGPPPPKLPELNQFKAKVVDDEGSLGGGDLFKNIK